MSHRKLHVSDKLSLPVDTATSSLVVYGGKGMGKTNFGSVVCEECALSGILFSFIDPMGVAWGLRHDASGKGRGIEVLILGGIHGDIPIEPTGGAVVADLVADENVSVVIDISRRPDGTMWSIGERIRFVRDYCKRLYQRQGETRRPILQIIDEAARFAPQVIRHGEGEVAACAGAVAVLVEEGRNVGIGILLLTQRSARLSKDVAELADCMIAFRTVGPNSMGAVLDWLGEHVEKSRHKELSEKLRALPRGDALVVSPGWLEFEGVVHVRLRNTFDSSATPKPGERVRRASGPGAKPDLGPYLARMAETIEQAKANDPKELRAEVARLKAELSRKPSSAPAAPAKTERVEVPVLDAKATKALDGAGASLERYAKVVESLVDSLGSVKASFDGISGKIAAATRQPAPSHVRMNGHARPPAPPRASPKQDHGTGDPSLQGGERKILTVLAQYPEGRTKVQLATLTGYAHNGGGFNNYLGALRSKKLIVDRGELILATTEGVSALGVYELLPVGDELRSYWLGKLDKAERAALGALIEAWPDPLTKEAVAAKAGYEANGGGFNNALGRLRTLELIYGRGEAIRASDALFSERRT